MPRPRRTSVRSAEAQTPAPSGNPLVARVTGASASDRKKILSHVHPLYAERSEQYRLLLDAYEGSGGFLTGGYLWKYPNEESDEFKERQQQARYHNYYRELVNIYARHVFRENVSREAKGVPELETWWQNVDGAGTSIGDFMKRGAKLALSTGIAGALVDKDPTPATGPSRAEDRGKVIASWFSAPVIEDWDMHAGELVAVKLLEAKARASILDPVPIGTAGKQYLFWTTEAWARFDANGEVVNASDASQQNTLGLVPLAIVRPDPSAEHPFIGQALGGNANLFRAHYNRCSEEDEVLRDQAFSLLTVSVPEDGNVEEAKTQIGTGIGTTRAVVVKGQVDYKTPDMQAPEQIRKNIEGLVKEIHRVAHVKFERDSLDAESADAIRLQHTELNEMLANLGAELQATERQIAKCWYAWTHPGDRATIEAEFAKLEITISYPKEFFVADLLQELEKWAKAIAMDMGLTFEKEAKKHIARQLLKDWPQKTLDAIVQEIDTQTTTKREQNLADAQAKFELGTQNRFGQKPGDKMPPEGAKAA